MDILIKKHFNTDQEKVNFSQQVSKTISEAFPKKVQSKPLEIINLYDLTVTKVKKKFEVESIEFLPFVFLNNNN